MIVVCGEALFDVFPERATATGMELSARIGGSPFNLAVGLARLGAAPLFFGGLSGDMFGLRLRAALAAEGVDTSAAPCPDAPTALVVVSVDGQGVPAYAFYGAGTAERMLHRADLQRLPADAQAIHVGSYCMVVEPVAATLRALVERQYNSSLIAYDPNVRPTIEPDMQVWRNALDWMLPRTDLLKVSDEDLHALYPSWSVADFITHALAAGVKLAVVTQGAQGVVAATASGAVAGLPAVPVTVVDTVGAGDTYQAALLAWLAQRGRLCCGGLDDVDEAALRAALEFAARAAAITCSRRGADLPYLQQLA